MVYRERSNTQITVGVILDKVGVMILLSERKNSGGHYDGFYSLPAGHVELGETVKDCIIREAKEEIDIELIDSKLDLVHVMHRKEKNEGINESIDFYFMTDTWKGFPKNVEPNKCNELVWKNRYNLPDNTVPYIKQALNYIFDDVSYSYYGW